MKKFIILLATVAMVAMLIFAGCARAPAPAPELRGFGPMKGVAVKPDGTSYTFEYLAPFLGFEFMVCSDNVIHSLIKRAGGEVRTHDAAGSLDAQFAAFEDAIVKRPDTIFFSTMGTKAIWPFVDKAVAAGIPVYDYDHVSYHPDIIFSVQFDREEGGRVMAQWLVDYAKETGEPLNVYHIWGNSATEADQESYRGTLGAFEGQPLITMRESPSTMYESEAAMDFVLDAFPAHPELNAVMTQYAMTSGIIEALRTIGRLYPVGHPDHVVIICYSSDPEVVRNTREGSVDGSCMVSPWEEADMFIKGMLTSRCLGRPLPVQQIITPAYMITIDNIDEARWEAPLIWSDMMMAEPDYDKWPLLDTSELGLYIPTRDMKEPGY